MGWLQYGEGVLGLGILVFGVAGCGEEAACSVEGESGVTVVLTFDDGPVSADLSEPETLVGRGELLEPLETILAVLAERGIRGVFFIEGPGDAASGAVLETTYGEGLSAIHEAGHVLGYHAFDHSAEIWISVLDGADLIRDRMRNDLDQLEIYLDGALGGVGLAREEVFTNVFRQPFGGGGIARGAAVEVAGERGWTYRGFRIDSVDWTDNVSTVDGVASTFGAETESERIDLVVDRLRAGAFRNHGRAVVDVLLHVNRFTARHLDLWIDTLASAFERTTRGEVRFGVPGCYLESDDAAVDTTPLTYLVGRE